MAKHMMMPAVLLELLLLCFSCRFVTPTCDVTSILQWTNHGGGILNQRDACLEEIISPSTVSKLARKWQVTTQGGVSATPAVFGGVVYFPSFDGNVYAVLAQTGTIIWKQNLARIIGAPVTVFSQATPVVFLDRVLIDIAQPAVVLALSIVTGTPFWSSVLDTHPFASVTMSGTAYGSSYYVGVSSQEELLSPAGTCCTFQGKFLSLNLFTGAIQWSTLMLPDNNNAANLYSGAAIWGSSPAIDVLRNLVIFATGNLYGAPANVTQCEQIHSENPLSPDPCIQPGDHSESVLALNLGTGSIVWSKHLGGFDTWNGFCLQPKNPNCPPIPGPDADFGEAPMLLTIQQSNGGALIDVAVVGQKNGFVYALNRDNGNVVWETVAGPGSVLGGAIWGSATDGIRVYTNIANRDHLPFTLSPSTTVTTAGGWVGIDANNGNILWSTAASNGSVAVGPVTVANGVLFVTAYGTPLGTLLALNSTTGQILWEYQTGSSLAGGVSVVNGCVYLGEGGTPTTDFGLQSVLGSHVDAFCVTGF